MSTTEAYEPEASQMPNPFMPSSEVRCCWNCKHWHVRDYVHCQCSGPFGGDIQGDPRCNFEHAKRIQIMREEIAELRAQAAAWQKHCDTLKRGECICVKCGLRQDGKKQEAPF